MIAAEKPPQTRGTIMVVDDNPANLKLLEEMLCQKGYEVRSFPRGRLALAAAAEDSPDLILLDINMPEMNGYEVCQRLKDTAGISAIPVLFLSALNQTQDKLKAFRCGGVDYIPKPFQLEEVCARVETHLALRRAQQAERDLLEQTLNGAIRTLSDLIHAASPNVAVRSRAIRDCVRWIAHRMSLSEPWQYDLAATLCLIGCTTLPEETFKRAYGGHFGSLEEEAMFRRHPECGARLLVNIPRLEPIAEMIRAQQGLELDPHAAPETKLGAQMLFVAVELDRRVYRGVPFPAALRELQRMPAAFDPEMLKALEDYTPAAADFHRATLPIKQLFAGMILDEDVSSDLTGIKIFHADTVLTETWIERLTNFAKSQGVREPLGVRVPGAASAPVFRSFGSMQRKQPEHTP
jgi:CheY-like chemotaxis protein